MADDQLQIFVSSSMSELPEERAAVGRAVERLQFQPFLYERHANATLVPAKEQWEAQLVESEICLVILHRKLGDYTKAEVNFARTAKTPILCYRRIDDQKTLESEHPEYLSELEDVEQGVSVRYFQQSADLERMVEEDVRQLLRAVFRRLRQFETGKVAPGPRRQGEQTDDGMDLREARRPRVDARRRDHVRLLDEPDGGVVGRDADVADLIDTVESGERLMAVTGPYGVGRRTMLRHFVREADQLGARFGDGFGAAPRHGGTKSVEDMLQSMWDLFFQPVEQADVVTVMDPRQREEQLEEVAALVVVEDAELAEGDFGEVSRQMRRSKLVVTTAQDWAGEEFPIEGLEHPADRRTVFEAASRLPLPDDTGNLDDLLERVGGSPFLIKALGRQAKKDLGRRADGELMGRWLAAMSEVSDEALETGLVPEEARPAFAAARRVGGLVPLGVLERAAGGSDGTTAGVRVGLMEAASPRFRASQAIGVPLPDDVGPGPSEIFEATLQWTSEAGPQELFENREFILDMLDRGADTGRWGDVITLARATEGAMAVGGRHGAWRSILEHAQTAARRITPPDAVTEAWALHQLGSMALLRDEVEDARGLLQEALEQREALGDEAAAELSRNNLKLVPLAIVSGGAALLIVVGLLLWGFAMASATAWADTSSAEAPDGDLDDEGAPDPTNESGTTPAGGSKDDDTAAEDTATEATAAEEPAEPTVAQAPPPADPDRSDTGSEDEAAASSPPGAGATASVPSIGLEAVGSAIAFPSDAATVTLAVTNTGEIDVAIEAIEVPSVGAAIDVSACSPTELAAGETGTCVFTIAAGGAPGEDVAVPVVVTVGDADQRSASGSIVVTIVNPEPLSVTLEATPSAVRDGGQVTFDLTARSDVELAIDNVAVSADPALVLGPIVCPPGKASAVAPYRCSFGGTVGGTAGTTPEVDVTVAASFAGEAVTDSATAAVSILAASEPAIAVQADWSISGDGLPDPGDVITFEYRIINAGDVALDGVTLTDTLTGAVSPVESLAVGAEANAAGTYTLTAADFANPTLTSSVSVTATSGGAAVSNFDSVTVPLRVAGLDVRVTADINGGLVLYTFEVENTGNSRLADVVVSDDLPGSLLSGCEFGPIAPGSVADCKGVHQPTDAELDARAVASRVDVVATAIDGTQLVDSSLTRVDFSVLAVSVNATTEPSDVAFTAAFGTGRQQLLPGQQPIRAAVPGTAGRPSNAFVRFLLPDDWALTTVSCAGARSDVGPSVVEVEVVTNGQAESCMFEVQGEPVVEVSPDALRFTVPGASQSFTMFNDGTASVTIGPIVPDSAEFTVTTDGCSSVALLPGATCAVTVTPTVGAGLGVIDLEFDRPVRGDVRVLLIGS